MESGMVSALVQLMVAGAFVAALALNMLMLARRWPQLMAALAGPGVVDAPDVRRRAVPA